MIFAEVPRRAKDLLEEQEQATGAEDVIAVRVPKALHQQLVRRARKEAVSLSHLIARLLAARSAVTVAEASAPPKRPARRRAG
jgi:predicted HicB family RNase H-like nuclease